MELHVFGALLARFGGLVKKDNGEKRTTVSTFERCEELIILFFCSFFPPQNLEEVSTFL